MKKIINLTVVSLVAVMMGSCTIYDYTSRSVKINRVDIKATSMLVDIEPDFDTRYTATSEPCHTKNAAIESARYKVLTENNIDLLVDPIYKMSYTTGRRKKWQATVVTFGAQYVNARPGTEEMEMLKSMKDVEMDDVVKYNILQHPHLMQQDKHGDMCPPAGDVITINNQMPETQSTRKADMAQVELQNEKLEAEKKDADHARSKAETAQRKAENERDKAEAAQRKAEEAKTKAETAKAQAETAKAQAEAAKTKAEAAQVKAEKEKALAESKQAKAEEAKAQAELAKSKAEAELSLAKKALEDATKAKEVAEKEAAQAIADKNFAEKVARKAIAEKQECEKNQ